MALTKDEADQIHKEALTDAPAPSAEVERALYRAKYVSERLAANPDAEFMAADDIGHVITLAQALTAERERVKALEAEVKRWRDRNWEATAEILRQEARATAAEATVREMREALERFENAPHMDEAVWVFVDKARSILATHEAKA